VRLLHDEFSIPTCADYEAPRRELVTKKRVLCIEDHPEMIDLVRLILERRGYIVDGAVGGREGLEAIERRLPDLILLDLMMPDMDGWEVFRQVKAREGWKDLPIVVITAKAQEIDKVLGLQIAGVDDYITKPFAPRDLIRSVERFLGSPIGEQDDDKGMEPDEG
jgi:two-component system response regulator VicR